MAESIAEVPIWLRTRRSVKCLGAMRRSSMAAPTRMTATGMLRPRRKRKDKHYRQKADNSIRESLLHCCTPNSMKTLH